jgi:hypothetical protein
LNRATPSPVKRSKSIRLVLIGGMATALGGCGPGDPAKAPVSAQSVYTNNFFVPGVGYYHAPFRAWYSQPYNHFDAQRKLFYFGGRWEAAPHESITNISAPTPEMVAKAQAQRSDVRRSGFGSSSRSHFISS